MIQFFSLVIIRIGYLEAAWSVTTLAAIAEEVVNSTLVDVRTHFARSVHLVAGVTDASVSADQVLASAVSTDVRILSALVDVC